MYYMRYFLCRMPKGLQCMNGDNIYARKSVTTFAFFLLRDGTHLKKSYLKTSKAPERHKLAIFFLVVTQYCGFRASYKTLDFFKDAILVFLLRVASLKTILKNALTTKIKLL